MGGSYLYSNYKQNGSVRTRNRATSFAQYYRHRHTYATNYAYQYPAFAVSGVPALGAFFNIKFANCPRHDPQPVPAFVDAESSGRFVQSSLITVINPDSQT